MKTFETRNDIKERILKEAAREWNFRGVSEIDLTAFDPIVDLMMGACSYELERLSNDITNSRNRMLERLVEILTPDVMTKAQPGYAIMHAMPSEYMHSVSPYDLVFHKRIESKRDIFFSAPEAYKIFNTRIELLAYENMIVRVNDRLEKDKVIESVYGKYVDPGTFHIGIKVDPMIRTMKNFTFFFDWKNQIRVNAFLKYLPLAQWFVSDKPINTRSGHNADYEVEQVEDGAEFNSLGMEKYIKNNVLSITSNHFVTLEDNDISIQENSKPYPSELNDTFIESDLMQLKDDLLWIKVVLPQGLKGHVKDMDCLMNCYPVINRNYFEKQNKISDDVYIIPVDVGEAHFLSIDNMTNSVGKSYKEVPLKSIDQGDDGMYALRTRGVKRFDTREAHHILNYTLDLINHEAAAFRGLDYNAVGEDFKELETVFSRIRKNFKKSKAEIEDTTFLFLSPYPGDNLVYIKYWTTDGSLANGIPYGTPLKLFSNSDLIANSLQLVTSSKGGKDQMQAVESIHAFKEVIMTRGRIVTAEDIRIFCTNALGFRNVESITVNKGVIVSKNANEGLIRTIDVVVGRKPNAMLSDHEWEVLCNETEVNLEAKSSGMNPIRIITKVA